MVVFPNAKINLGLYAVRKRADGYRGLETIFHPLHRMRDVLEIIRNSNPNPHSDIDFSASEQSIPGEPNDNLCIKAYQLLKKDFPALPPISMHLLKAIPMGAGLGGGSADGAFALMLINSTFNLGLDTNALIGYALQLGSDCPFFIINKPSYATGQGEQLEPLDLDLSKYSIAVISPGIRISTAWAFSQINPAPPESSLKEICKLPITAWQEQLVNVFEEPAMNFYPEIRNIKTILSDAGAVYVSLTGSGSSVYGIFSEPPILDNKFPKDYGLMIL